MSEWHNLYGESWLSEIVPEAFSHPAKFSRALIRHIYEHAIEEGWLSAGDAVIDPFGGVALGALDAMRHGLHWCGVELEPRFVELGQANIDLWSARYGPHFPDWGTARLVQGDSRELTKVIGEAVGCVSSPPYAETAMGANSKSIDREKQYETYRASGGGQSFEAFCHTQELHSHDYGSTPGQLGAMKANGFDAAVSSPPFENNIASDSRVGNAANYTGHKAIEYAPTNGNLGNSDDFWTAALAIVQQVYAVLAPGAHVIWVVKAFVKSKQRVDFPGQWKRLCHTVGFQTVHYHRAWLVEDRGAQYDLFGELHEKKVEHKSFFRRLAEKNGSPTIDYEVVLCMVKPGNLGNMKAGDLDEAIGATDD